MAISVLPDLITAQDSFEIVRDRIALIIAANYANQFALASGEPDPSEWAAKVYTERSNPWDAFLEGSAPNSVIVNVWFSNSSFDKEKSDVVEHQVGDGVFNVDVYSRGIARSDGAAGHIAGDKDAANVALRAARLIRNFLMAAENTYLQLRAIDVGETGPAVWQRWIQAITQFQPEISDSETNVVGVRLTVGVTYSEHSPQVAGDVLEFVSVDVRRDSDGLLIAEADFDYAA